MKVAASIMQAFDSLPTINNVKWRWCRRLVADDEERRKKVGVWRRELPETEAAVRFSQGLAALQPP